MTDPAGPTNRISLLGIQEVRAELGVGVCVGRFASVSKTVDNRVGPGGFG